MHALHGSGFSCCRAQALELLGFSSCVAWATEHMVRSCGPWHLPRPEVKPTSPALAGGFLTTRPQGSPIMPRKKSVPSPPIEKKRKKVKSLSRVRLFAAPWTVAYQARLSMEFSRQEYCSGLPPIRVVKSCLPFPGTGVGDIFTNGNFLYKYMFPL